MACPLVEVEVDDVEVEVEVKVDWRRPPNGPIYPVACLSVRCSPFELLISQPVSHSHPDLGTESSRVRVRVGGESQVRSCQAFGAWKWRFLVL